MLSVDWSEVNSMGYRKEKLVGIDVRPRSDDSNLFNRRREQSISKLQSKPTRRNNVALYGTAAPSATVDSHNRRRAALQFEPPTPNPKTVRCQAPILCN